MSAVLICCCPIFGEDQKVPTELATVAPSCCRGISIFWPCTPCRELHQKPLSVDDFDRLSGFGFDFFTALGGAG